MMKYMQSRGFRRSKYILGHQQMKDAVYMSQKERKHRKRVKIIQFLGSVCEHCGLEYNGHNGPVFEFHHTDPDMKEFILGNCDRALSKLLAEAEKCELLCANCHNLLHAEGY
jgi:predicted HNH restriction endonuclease